MSDTPEPTGARTGRMTGRRTAHDRGAGATGHDADYLVEQYVTGRLSRDEAARLLALLAARPDLADGLVDQVGMDAMLRGLGRAEVWEPDSAAPTNGAIRDSAVVPPPARPKRAKLKFPADKPARLLATAACLGIGCWRRGPSCGRSAGRARAPRPAASRAAPGRRSSQRTSRRQRPSRSWPGPWTRCGRTLPGRMRPGRRWSPAGYNSARDSSRSSFTAGRGWCWKGRGNWNCGRPSRPSALRGG